ncbi:hypothetical protein ACQSHD_15435, partial [Klebsiella pneumoniae]
IRISEGRHPVVGQVLKEPFIANPLQLAPQRVCHDPRARCGDVLTGRCKPHQCPLFASTCNPQSAFGALMVSSEGACAAWYQYRSQENEV